jgi:hypothetical protein
MRAMDLDAIEARLARPARGGGEGGYRHGDALGAHRLGNDRLQRHLEDGMRDGGRRDRRLAANVLPGMAAGMAELNRRFRAARMDRGDEARQPRQEAVVIKAELAPAMPARLLGRRHLDGDEADAARDARAVIGEQFLGDLAFRIGEPRRHRRQHDAIAHLDRSDARRRQEDAHAEPARGPEPSARRRRSARPDPRAHPRR